MFIYISGHLRPQSENEIPMSIESDVNALATDSGRSTGSQGHLAAKRYLLERLSALSLEPYRDETFEIGYQANGQDYSNILAMIEGTDPDLSPVLLGAHYDAVEGTPGADLQSLYVGLIQEKIYKNWRDPLAERHSKEAIISFRIFPKGNIDKPFIKQSSEVEVLDTLAVRAVLDSVPFPKFPKELKKSNLLLSIYFKYVPKDQ